MRLNSPPHPRRRRWTITAATLLSLSLAACAQRDARADDNPVEPEPARQPDTQLGQANDQPRASGADAAANADHATDTGAAAQQPATANPAEAWLDKIEKRSAEIKSLRARLVYDRIQGLQGDEQTRFGTLIYSAGPPATFAIHFERLKLPVGDKFKIIEQNRWYIFDGVWLVERLDDKKQFLKRQVVPPPAKDGSGKDKQPDPLTEGAGPFVLPLNLKKSAIMSRFNVELVEPAGEAEEGEDAAPKDALHLKLTPRPDRRMDFTEVELWYDRATLLPLRVRTIDRSENESIIAISKPEPNAKIDPRLIDTSEPKEAGWEVSVTPWEE